VSFATVFWIDVFIRSSYLEILAESIIYCRAKKGLELFAYCFMPNHLHLIFRSATDDPAGILRDFKKFTSKKVVQAIENNPQESRKEWLLGMFKEAGKGKKNIKSYQFWQHHNQPIELWSPQVIKQKIDYIHRNPVEAGFVTSPADWKYSSARNFQDDHTVLQIDEIGFMGLDN